MQEWNIGDILTVARHRWRVVVGTFVLLSAVGFLRLSLATPVYRAEGKVLFSLSGSLSLPLGDNPIAPSAFIGAEFANRQERLTSLDFLTRVGERLPDSIRVRLGSDSLPPDRLARILQGRLRVTGSREGSVYTIRFTHTDPVVAAAVINTLMETFVDEDLRIRRRDVAQSLEYVEAQLEKYAQKLEEAENRLLAFRQRHGGIALSDLSTKLFEDLSRADEALQELQARQNALRRRIRALRETPASSDTQALALSPRLRQLQDRLVELEVNLRTLQAQGLDTTHPRMKRLLQEIQRLRATLGEELRASLFRPDALSLMDSLRSALFWADVESRVLSGQIAFWVSRRDSIMKHLQDLPALEQDYLRLLRDREITEKIYRMLTEKREELRIALESRTSPLQILEYARVPTAPIRPRKALEGALTLILAFFAGLGVALLREWSRPTVHHLEEITALTPAPILAVIPRKKHLDRLPPYRRRLDTLSEPDAFQEAFFKLYTSLQPDLRHADILLMTSATAHEGKSLVLTNTALTFTRMGHRVCVVEADLRRPHVHLYFDFPQEPGLREYLEERASLDDVLLPHPSGVMVVPSGSLPPSPAPLLRSPRLAELLRELKGRCDLILVDSPPVGLTSDAALLYPYVDGVVLLVRMGVTPLRLLQHVLSTLPGDKLRGVVVNDADPAGVYGYDGYDGYYGGYPSNGARGWPRFLSCLRRRISS